ncbi:hypothetical protein HRR56_03360 [Streptococcus pyogenes]|uniref:hypothetical protein n=1 Tax=Streptococcus pyogenes TaxID=1314 RepID=UPI0015745954|nr:hypothetical protein [Streptococcus pyogenes]
MTQVAQGRSKGKSLLCHQCNALFVFIIFLILLAVLFGVRYRNSSIEGIWRTTSIDQKLGDDFAKRLTGLHQSPLIDDSLLTSSQMILTVKNNNVDLSFSVQVERDIFVKRLAAYHQNELLKTLKENHLVVGDLSSKERQIIENSMPASHELEMILDQAFEKLASQIGGKYNQKTGHLSAVVLKEEVAAGHTSFSKGLLTPNGYFDYTRFGKKLELLGDEKIIFKKALKKSPSSV